MSIAYDTIAPRYARHRDGHAFVIAILDRLLAKFPGGSVLEVGSGTGVYATGRADAGARALARYHDLAILRGQSDPERHQPQVNTIDRSGGCRQDYIFPVDIL